MEVNRNNILLASGSDAGIRSVYETYISDGDEVIITLPNYAMFSAYADMFGANQVQHFYNNDLSLNSDRLIKKISSKTRLIVISNPGHTGTIIPDEDLKNIIITVFLNPRAPRYLLYTKMTLNGSHQES